MEEVTIKTIEWQGKEYNHKKRGADFLWTIGLIAFVGAVIAIFMGNYVFAIFILISGACLIMFTIREPGDINFSIKTEGLSIGKDNYPWKSLKSFDIKSGLPAQSGESYSKLLVHTSRHFLPIYTIPLPSGIKSEVRESLLKFIPQSEIEESRSMQFAEKLGL
ncbi:MAG: hypothetical protein AAB477_00475 [Patescibacteria group bacterium]